MGVVRIVRRVACLVLAWLALGPSWRRPCVDARLMRRVLLLAASQAVVLMWAPVGARAEGFCTDKWKGPSEGEWSVAADWSAGHVPESGDVACIGSGATVRVTGTGNVAGTVQGEGTLEVVGSLEVASAFEPSSLHGLAIGGGTLTGAASVQVTGTLSWEYGEYEGSGELVVGSGASGTWGDVTIGGSGVVRNEGTVTLGTGTFTMTETARFVNAGTFKANAESTPPVFRVYKGTPSILNTGLFEKTAGTGRTEIGIPLESEGTIDGASGELRFFEKTEVMLGSSVLEGAIERSTPSITTKKRPHPTKTAAATWRRLPTVLKALSSGRWMPVVPVRRRQLEQQRMRE